MSTLRTLVLAALAVSVLAAGAVAQDFTLTIFHNNDGESDLLPDGDGYGGAAHFLTKLNELRAAATTDGHLVQLRRVPLAAAPPAPAFAAAVNLRRELPRFASNGLARVLKLGPNNYLYGVRSWLVHGLCSFTKKWFL